MTQRNRAAGWQHAKLSGHSNEALVKELLDTNPEYVSKFMFRISHPDESIISTSIGGLHEKTVPGILGRKTKSKTDLKIICSSGENINISIKKSLTGQAYFVSSKMFIEVFERQFCQLVPAKVQRAIKLFWTAADDAISIIEQYGDKEYKKGYDLQIRHKSLNATTLYNYDTSLYNALLDWFMENMYEITKLSLSMGAAKSYDEWSEYIWYINLLGEHEVDEIFYIDDICDAAFKASENETFYGDKNGGTTIQLPFGFVEWHQGKLQFHHSYEKICSLI